MKRPTDRRTILMTAGAAVLATAARPVVAQPAPVSGAVTFEKGAAVPKGTIDIALEDPAIQDSAQRRVATTRVESDGASKAIAFTLAPPAGSTVSPTLRVVARLERADGWLLARGSAPLEPGSPANVSLNAVMY